MTLTAGDVLAQSPAPVTGASVFSAEKLDPFYGLGELARKLLPCSRFVSLAATFDVQKRERPRLGTFVRLGFTRLGSESRKRYLHSRRKLAAVDRHSTSLV